MGMLDAENANRPSNSNTSRPAGQTATGHQGLSGLVSSGGGGSRPSYSGSYGHGGGYTGAYSHSAATSQGFTRSISAAGGAGGSSQGTGNHFSGSGPGANPFSAAVNSFQAPRPQVEAPQVQNRANPTSYGQMPGSRPPGGTIARLNYNDAVNAGVNMAQTPIRRNTANYQPNYNPTAQFGSNPVVSRPGATDFADFYAPQAPARQQSAFAGGAEPGAPAGPARSIFTPGAQQGYNPSAAHQRVIDTLIAEADLSDPMGLVSVAHTMNNRAKYSGASIYDIASAPDQYTGYGSPGEKAREAQQNPRIRAAAEQAFQDAVTGRVPDPTGGADFFHTPAVSPGWASKFQHTADIGGHKFYQSGGQEPYGLKRGQRGGGVTPEAQAQFVSGGREQDTSGAPMPSLAALQMAEERAGKVSYADPGSGQTYTPGGIGSDRDMGRYAAPLSGSQSPTRGPAMRGSVPPAYRPGEESYTPYSHVSQIAGRPEFPGQLPAAAPEHSTPFVTQDEQRTQEALAARRAHVAETARVRASMSRDDPVADRPLTRGLPPPREPDQPANRGNPQADLYYGETPQSATSTYSPDGYRPEDSPRAAATNPIQAAVEADGGSWRDTLEKVGGAVKETLLKTEQFYTNPAALALKDPKEFLSMAKNLAKVAAGEALDAGGREISKALNAVAPRAYNIAAKAGTAAEALRGVKTSDPVEFAIKMRDVSGSAAKGWETLERMAGPGGPTEMQKAAYSRAVGEPMQTVGTLDEPGYTPPDAPDWVDRMLGPSGAIIGAGKYAADTSRPAEGMAERAAQIAEGPRKVKTESIAYQEEYTTGEHGKYVSPISGTYANKSSNIYGAGREGGNRLHAGGDWNAADGSPVQAVIGGKVVYTGSDPGGYGAYADVLGDDGFVTRYAAHESISVKKGDVVTQGQPIGVVGKGHLHLEVMDPNGGAHKDAVAGRFGNTQRYSGPDYSQTIDPATHFGIPGGTKNSYEVGGQLNGSQLKTYTGGFGGTGTTVAGQNLKDVTSPPAAQRGLTVPVTKTNVWTGETVPQERADIDAYAAGAYQKNMVQAIPAAGASPAADNRPRTASGMPIAQPAGMERPVRGGPAGPGSRETGQTSAAQVSSLTERLQSYRGRDHAGTAISQAEVNDFIQGRSTRLLGRLTTGGRLEALAELGRMPHAGSNETWAQHNAHRTPT